MKQQLHKLTLLILINLLHIQTLSAHSPNEDGCVPPPAPTNTSPIANTTICSGKFTILSVSGTGTIGWYSASVGGTYLGGGSTFTTPILTSNTTYYAQDSTCDASASRTAIFITVNPLPNVTASSSSASICVGSQVTLASSNAASYAWAPGPFTGSSITITPAGFTTYTVTGTDANGCTNTSSIAINVFPLPNVGTSVTASTICAGSSTTINGTGANFYNWQPGTLSGSILTLSPLVTTTYTVTGVDAGTLCSKTATRTITVNPAPPVLASASNTTLCVGGTSNLSGTGASSYVWIPGNISGANITVTPSASTTYTVTGTNSANGCTSKSTVAIVVNTLPTIATSTSLSTICQGASTTINATGGVSYLWQPGALSGSSLTVTPSSTTVYTVTGTNANGCNNTATITINVNPLPPLSTSASLSTICVGGSTTLTGIGANIYTWQPGSLSGTSINVTPNATTTYTVTGTIAATSCSTTAVRTITVNSLPILGNTGNTAAVCSGTSITIGGTGADSYTWNPGGLIGASIVVTPLNTTTYTVTGTNAATGCSNTSTLIANINSLPNVVTSVSNASICAGASTTITGNGANTYTWEPGSLSGTSITVSPTATTTYTVTGTSTATGCSKTAIRTITVNVLPTTAVSATLTTTCAGSPTTLTATGANTYTWTGGLTGSSITVSPFGNTTYVVTGTNAAGCTKTASITINVNGLSNVNTTVNTSSICPGSSAIITATGSVSYVWQPGGLIGNSVSVSPSVTTTYTVTGTNTSGCTKTATRTITVLSCGSTLNLKLFIEGYYNGGGLMKPVMMNQGIAGANATQTDSITVELRNTNAPYGIAHALKTIVNTNGTALCNFPITGTYYIAVKHRNGLQTWSANPLTLSSTPVTYDFTIANTQAYGSIQADLGSGVYGFYSGDLNADENVDLLDLSQLDADISNFIFGYFATDINGDGNVDLLDSPTVETNINNFVFSGHP